MKKDINDSFSKKIYECNKHVEKLHDAKEYLKDIMPLTLEKYVNINKIQSSFIDQLNFRFSKLQDTIARLSSFLIVIHKEKMRSVNR